jgi:hypothetical protein
MPLRQLRNHAISLSFGQSTLWPVFAARMNGRVILELQFRNRGPPGNWTAGHDEPGCVRFAWLHERRGKQHRLTTSPTSIFGDA